MKKLYKKKFIGMIMLYFVVTLISQQKTLNTYKKTENDYSKKIQTANETKEKLLATKESVSSIDYIEEVAREKLDMYLPNERIYVDVDK